ncbi:hypothetical protein VNO78_11373 [Psophocarpus tetragonolobus]|uniref:Uncharacterized protein n=1 Tax=Psophocarpus tetragonolobus TaxID=3891 RepID=A0AAN9SMA6_PSOTE
MFETCKNDMRSFEMTLLSSSNTSERFALHASHVLTDDINLENHVVVVDELLQHDRRLEFVRRIVLEDQEYGLIVNDDLLWDLKRFNLVIDFQLRHDLQHRDAVVEALDRIRNVEDRDARVVHVEVMQLALPLLIIKLVKDAVKQCKQWFNEFAKCYKIQSPTVLLPNPLSFI